MGANGFLQSRGCYQPGGLVTVLTRPPVANGGGDPRRRPVQLLRQGRHPPYRYVSVEGPAVAEEELDFAERLAMAIRSLGTAGGDRYVAGNPDPGRENVAFRMRPEHWLCPDQARGSAAR
jgi:hypothetical protein